MRCNKTKGFVNVASEGKETNKQTKEKYNILLTYLVVHVPQACVNKDLRPSRSLKCIVTAQRRHELAYELAWKAGMNLARKC